MAEYQSYTGIRVIVVFDAHLVKGIEKTNESQSRSDFYTGE